jgi:hypothetical protein
LHLYLLRDDNGEDLWENERVCWPWDAGEQAREQSQRHPSTLFAVHVKGPAGQIHPFRRAFAIINVVQFLGKRHGSLLSREIYIEGGKKERKKEKHAQRDYGQSIWFFFPFSFCLSLLL